MSAPDRGQLKSWTVLRSALLSGTVITASLLPGGGGGPPAAPVNIVAPVISGTAQQDSVLTLTSTGTWSPDATNFTQQWKRDGVSIAGETTTTYTLVAADVGHTITCALTGINGGGSSVSPGVSNGIGPVAAPGAIAAPTITNVSAAGVTPVVLSVSDGQYIEGKYLQWEFAGSHTPATNADGSYTTPAQWGITFIDGDSWARLDLTLGYSDPSGDFAFHARVLQDDDAGTAITDPQGQTANYDTSAWSSDYTDTISGSAAKLASPSGVNLSHYITVAADLLTATYNAGVGSYRAGRTTIPFTGQKHFELTIVSGGSSTNGQIAIGFDDGETTPGLDAASGYPNPGKTYPGATVMVKPSGGTLVWTNGVQTSGPSLGFAPAAGDVLSAEADTATGHVLIQYHRASDSSVTTLLNATLTSQIPATWYGTHAGYFTNDKYVANFGGSAFTVTPTAGYTGW